MNNQPSVWHTFKMLFVLAWVIVFSYPALWHIMTPSATFRQYHRWKKINRLIDEKVYPFFDAFHALSYPVHNAALRGRGDKIAHLTPTAEVLNSPDAFKTTPLAYATMNCDYELMQTFLDSGAFPDVRIFDDSTALHQAVLNSDEKAALILLDNGARPDIPDKNGQTVIHLAIKSGMKKVFLQTLKTDFNLNAPDLDGLTPLDYAIRQNSYEMVTALARGGAQPLFNSHGRDVNIAVFLAQWRKTGDFEHSVKFVAENAHKYNKSSPDMPVPAELPVDLRPARPPANGEKYPHEDL